MAELLGFTLNPSPHTGWGRLSLSRTVHIGVNKLRANRKFFPFGIEQSGMFTFSTPMPAEETDQIAFHDLLR